MIKTMETKDIIEKALSQVVSEETFVNQKFYRFSSGKCKRSYVGASEGHIAGMIYTDDRFGYKVNTSVRETMDKYYNSVRVGIPGVMNCVEIVNYHNSDLVKIERNVFKTDYLRALCRFGLSVGVNAWSVWLFDNGAVLESDGAWALIMSMHYDEDKEPNDVPACTMRTGNPGRVDYTTGQAFVEKFEEEARIAREAWEKKKRGKIWAVEIVKRSHIYVEAANEAEALEIADDNMHDVDFDTEVEIGDTTPELVDEDDIDEDAEKIYGSDQSWPVEDYPYWDGDEDNDQETAEDSE